MLFRRFATATVALLALTLGAAHAEDLDTVTTTVSYADLNLSQAADDQVLAQRLGDAARSVCHEAYPDTPTMVQPCIDAAVNSAMAQVEDRLDEDVDTKMDVIRTALATP